MAAEQGGARATQNIYKPDIEFNCKNNKTIHCHYLSSNYFFEPRFLSSFYLTRAATRSKTASVNNTAAGGAGTQSIAEKQAL